MEYYISGYIKEINAGFKVSLLNGMITGTFHSDKQATEFTTKNMKKFVNERDAHAAVKFTRIDGIKTYLMYSKGTLPFEMCEFDFIESHSGYFPKSKLRSVIDTHHVDYNNIARVSSSGTPRTSNINSFRIFIDLLLYIVLGGIALHCLKNPTSTMSIRNTDNTNSITIFTIALVFASIIIAIVISRKIYYATLVGRRSRRTNSTLKKVSEKKWGLFRVISKILDLSSLVMTVIQLVLLIVGISIIWKTIYFDNAWQTYFAKILLFLDIIHCTWMIYFSIRVLIRSNKLENSLLKIHIPNKTKKSYVDFLYARAKDIKNFDSRNTHFVLRIAPLKILSKVLKAEQKLGLEARRFKKKRKKIFLEKISDYDAENYYSDFGE